MTMAQGDTTWLQLSRGAAAELDLTTGEQVWVSRAGTARTVTPPHDGNLPDDGVPTRDNGDLAPIGGRAVD